NERRCKDRADECVAAEAKANEAPDNEHSTRTADDQPLVVRKRAKVLARGRPVLNGGRLLLGGRTQLHARDPVWESLISSASVSRGCHFSITFKAVGRRRGVG